MNMEIHNYNDGAPYLIYGNPYINYGTGFVPFGTPYNCIVKQKDN